MSLLRRFTFLLVLGGIFVTTNASAANIGYNLQQQYLLRSGAFKAKEAMLHLLEEPAELTPQIQQELAWLTGVTREAYMSFLAYAMQLPLSTADAEIIAALNPDNQQTTVNFFIKDNDTNQTVASAEQMESLRDVFSKVNAMGYIPDGNTGLGQLPFQERRSFSLYFTVTVKIETPIDKPFDLSDFNAEASLDFHVAVPARTISKPNTDAAPRTLGALHEYVSNTPSLFKVHNDDLSLVQGISKQIAEQSTQNLSLLFDTDRLTPATPTVTLEDQLAMHLYARNDAEATHDSARKSRYSVTILPSNVATPNRQAATYIEQSIIPNLIDTCEQSITTLESYNDSWANHEINAIKTDSRGYVLNSGSFFISTTYKPTVTLHYNWQ